jgi:DNA-binding Xre family transcriptional regulator
MIRLNIQEMARRKGITNPYQLAMKAECSTSKADRLWNGGTEHPKLETLDHLCAVLGCKMWELITWSPNGAHKAPAAKRSKSQSDKTERKTKSSVRRK